MPNPKMPPALRKQLHKVISRVTAGPEKIDDPTEGPEFNRGMKAAVERCSGWRHSWIEHELRQIAAWADGAESAHDIKVYGAGLDYGK